MKDTLGFLLLILTLTCSLSARAATLPAAKPKQFTSPDQVPEGLAKSDWSSIRAAYEAGRHQFFKQEDGSHVARNPGLGWKMVFDEHGFTAQPDDGAWTWGLELVLKEPAERGLHGTAAGNRFSVPRTPAITEWFVNDPRGLEQGWTLSAPAEIQLRVRGCLKPSVSPQSISFGGQLTYSGLKAWDATGKTIPTHFEATAEGFAVRYDDTGAQYPLTIDPIAQQAYLKASNTDANDYFGYSVAVSGDTVVIGAVREASNATGVNGNQADNSVDGAGAAYVFTRSGGTWTQQAYLKASNTAAIGDYFGCSVAVSGDTVVIGAYGERSSATGVGGNQVDYSAPGSGAAYVFTRSGTTWTQQAYLKASNTGMDDYFGSSVAVSGDVAVIGAPNESSNATGVNGNEADNSVYQAGAAYVFVRSGSTWTQQAYLKASNTGAGAVNGWGDQFGNSVAVSGDTAVIGAYQEDSNATGVGGDGTDNSALDSGAAYVFVRSGTTWMQQAYLKASNTGASDFFGFSVALSGNTAVIGALSEASNATGVNGNQADNSIPSSGAAYVFTRSAGVWTQQAYLKAGNTGAGDSFGYSVAISGDTAVIGAAGEDSNATGVGGNQADDSTSNSGAAYVFVRSGSTWTPQAYLKASNTGAGDDFGYSMAVSGDTVVIGAPWEASNATGVNGNQADNSLYGPGAAYVFTGLGPVVVAPAITGISPTSGRTAGGTSVIITGSDFTGAPAVTFSGVAATDVTVVDSTTITCTTPAGSAGSASVVVTTPLGSNAANTLFTYVPPAPTITAVSPSSGSAAGGTSVTITGTGFTGATGVTFGLVMATGVTVVNDTTITCTTPAGSAGAASIVVTTPGGTNAANTLFTYVPVPTVAGTSPSSGSAAGGTSVTITGTGFTGATGVTFGLVMATGVTVVNDTTITCTTPAGSAGAASVVVTTPGGSNAANTLFTYTGVGPLAALEAYLKASNTGANDYFGFSVVVSGDTAVIGATGEASNSTGVGGNGADNSAYQSGAAYVFVRSGSTWTQQAYLKASNTEAGDQFGVSVAVSGDTAVIGASGEDSNATGVDGSQADNSASNSGAAYVFVRSGSTWAQQAYLKASNTGAGDGFGVSVALSGDTVVIGAANESSSATGVGGNQADNSALYSGAAYVFTRSGSTWTQQAYFKASNTRTGDTFGYSVAVSGDTAVIGAFGETSNATGVNGNQVDNSAYLAGAAYVFVRSGSTWTQQAYLKASNTEAHNYFGLSVAVSGDTAVIGAPGESSNATGVNGNQTDNSANASGAAYVFNRIGGTWTQQAYLKASNTGTGDQFGNSVAVSGDTVVIGAPGESSSATGVNGNQTDNSVSNSGAAYVFTRTGGTWTQQAYLKASNTGAKGNDFFGYFVAVSGDTAVIGAYGEASNATGVNGNQADNSASASGSAYIFTGLGPEVTVAGIFPTIGSTAGGTNVTINGAGFTGATAVTIGGTTATGFTVVNDTTITATTPAGSAGAASVVVATPLGSNAANTLFTYAPAPTVTGIFPSSGSAAGGTSVTITGTGFTGATGVTFGLVMATGVTVVNDTTITCTTPAGSAGAASVVVTTPGGSNAANTLFTYTGVGPLAALEAYLKASNTGAGDWFGFSVAVSGDTAVIGAVNEASNATGVNGNQADNSVYGAGAAYVFTRSGGTWTQQAYLKASNPGGADWFGYSVAVSGDTVVIGAPYEASNATGVNGNQADNSVGNAGAAYVFTRSGSTWTQQAYLKASNTGAYDYFGSSVAVSGDTVVIGAPYESSNATGVGGDQADNSAAGSGAAYVFTRSGSTWTQQVYLKASNTGADDRFGSSVAASGGTVVIGAYLEDSNAAGVNGNQADNSATDAGAAYVFTLSAGVWTQQAYLKASNAEALDNFGDSMAVSGDTVVVGASGEDSNATGVNGNQANNSLGSSGAAYVFVRSGSTWTQQAYLKASNSGDGDRFGSSVAMSGDIVVIGAYQESSNATGVNGNQADNSIYAPGAAYVFKRSGSSWTQQAYLKASNTGVYEYFGFSVAVSGGTAVIGAYLEDSNATGVNGNQADNSAGNSGAAYTFTLPAQLTPAQVFDATLTAAGLSGPNAALYATPYGDGVANLLKYAFNMNLSGPDATTMAPGGGSGLPSISISISLRPNGASNVFRFEFLRRVGSGLIYAPQKSVELTNPASWTPLDALPTVIPIDANWERAIYDEPYDAATTPRSFGRVQVTLP